MKGFEVKGKIGYLGFFLFTLSLIAVPLNVKVAMALLMASFGSFLLGGLLNGSA